MNEFSSSGRGREKVKETNPYLIMDLRIQFFIISNLDLK